MGEAEKTFLKNCFFRSPHTPLTFFKKLSGRVFIFEPSSKINTHLRMISKMFTGCISERFTKKITKKYLYETFSICCFSVHKQNERIFAEYKH